MGNPPWYCARLNPKEKRRNEEEGGRKRRRRGRTGKRCLAAEMRTEPQMNRETNSKKGEEGTSCVLFQEPLERL